MGEGGEEAQPAGASLASAKWYRRAKQAGVPVVAHRWLLDSIGAYTAKPVTQYLL
jgi:hypothetical protein